MQLDLRGDRFNTTLHYSFIDEDRERPDLQEGIERHVVERAVEILGRELRCSAFYAVLQCDNEK